MRFIVLGMATKESEAGPPPKPEAFAAMQKYNEELVKAGILLAAEGLTASSQGVRVKFSGDERIVVDGPFAESKEVVAGWTFAEPAQSTLGVRHRVPSDHPLSQWPRTRPNPPARASRRTSPREAATNNAPTAGS